MIKQVGIFNNKVKISKYIYIYIYSQIHYVRLCFEIIIMTKMITIEYQITTKKGAQYFLSRAIYNKY